MMSIWKFPIERAGKQVIEIPSDAQILSVHLQSGCLCLWAVVSTDSPPETRTISIFGTGHPFDREAGEFIGTVIDGQFVWHVFAETPNSKPT